MMKIIFDVETTGLPVRPQGFDKYYDPSRVEYYNSWRMVQLGYIVIDDENKEVKEYSSIVLPVDFRIENEEIHGISNERALNEGKDVGDVLRIFFNDVKRCDTLIAHNIKFDFNIVLSEMYRLGMSECIREFGMKKLYCTMAESKKIFGFCKSPKLVELFSHLHRGKTWNQIHDALDDARCCMASYVKMNSK